MQTLWFMQAALQDLAPTRHNTQSFVICQRVLHKCHEIIFGDLPPPATLPYASLNLPFQSRFTRKKVRPHAEPALIGLGMVLAGVPGMPKLTKVMGEVAIEQGRAQDEGQEAPRLANQDDDLARGVTDLPGTNATEDDDNDLDEEIPDDPLTASPEELMAQHSRGMSGLDAFGHRKPKENSSGRRQTIGAAKTSPALPLHMRNILKPRLSDDPLGQNDHPLPVRSASPYRSTPSISLSSKQPHHSSALSGADLLLQKYDFQSQGHLLRSQYCRSEVCYIFYSSLLWLSLSQVQFLLTLESISNRLLVVPRPARVSALRAELTALNHKLPAEVNFGASFSFED
jgi:phosphatidylinositol 4-kinase